MNEITFAAICGARLATALHEANAIAPPNVTKDDHPEILIYATCADQLGPRIEAGETVSVALARWIAFADAALTAYRGARSRSALIDQTIACAAPRAVLQAAGLKWGGVPPTLTAIALAPVEISPTSRLIAEYAVMRSPGAQDLEAELKASSLAIVPDDEERMKIDAARPVDLDGLAAEIRQMTAPLKIHAEREAEIAALRDMLERARACKSANANRIAEQMRKIEAQHGLIRELERELGEARGAVRQAQNWLRDAAAT